MKEMSANTAFCAFVPGCTKVEHTLVTLVNDDHVDFTQSFAQQFGFMSDLKGMLDNAALTQGLLLSN